jgi:hypothetical protein
LIQNYTCPGGLFLDAAVGVRRAFSSFATNTYLTLASYIYGCWSGTKIALALANACALKLIELQGPHGEWPWFFYSPASRVVDFYEVYSVHQMGMAPAFLEYAEQHRGKRMLRATFNAVTRRSGELIDPSKLQLRLECRSYELGWILWSFGGRRDLTEIQYHEDFRENRSSHLPQQS